MKQLSFDMYPDTPPQEEAGADFSDCGKYRFKLWRIWDRDLPMAMLVNR